MSDADWLAGFELTLMSVVRAVRAALPWMEGQPGANVIAIVSSSAKVPIEDLVLSNAFRPAIVGLAKTLSQELAPRGVRVNSVAPGRIDTERVRHLDGVHGQRHGVTSDEWRRRSQATIPMGRYGTVEEFADAVAFLASDAARYVTGQCLFVDGGLTRTLM
jgi:3-oxoacyl-[acyl-carrier protein] reductase